MKTTLVSAFLLAQLGVSYAQSPIDQCRHTIVYDTVALDRNVLVAVSLVLSMDQQTFENTKKNLQAAGLTAYGLFDGSYADAQQKAREMHAQINYDLTAFDSSKYATQTLSPRSAEMYADCIRATSGAPISAWLVPNHSKTVAVVRVRLGDAWTRARISASGATPIGHPKNLLVGGGSELTLRFRHAPDRSFSVDITATQNSSGQTRSVTVEKVPVKNFSETREYAHDTCVAECVAGGNGDPSRRRYSGCSFVAPENGWRYAATTATKVSEENYGGSGVSTWNPTWVVEPAGSSAPRVVRLTEIDCTGHRDRQGGSAFTYILERSRTVYEEVR